MSIFLPISIGEALDKLTILEIKLKYIQNENKLKNVKIEYDELIKDLLVYKNKVLHYYNILLHINENIWNIQDNVRSENIKQDDNACKLILDENDRRCRIKTKINNKFNSILLEQKGYRIKKALLYSHLGLGDMICMIGVARYLATKYDEVYIVCKQEYYDNVKLFYKDDKDIHIILTDQLNLKWNPNNSYYELDNETYKDYTPYICGIHSSKYLHLKNEDYYDIPNIFYKQLDIDYKIVKEYFYVDDYSNSYIDFILDNYKNYIFVHDSSSNSKFNLSSKLLEQNSYSNENKNLCIINPCNNPYNEDHIYYELNKNIQNKPILFFKKIIENAHEIHCIDSSFSNFINFLDTSNVKNIYLYFRENRSYSLFNKMSTIYV